MPDSAHGCERCGEGGRHCAMAARTRRALMRTAHRGPVRRRRSAPRSLETSVSPVQGKKRTSGTNEGEVPPVIRAVNRRKFGKEGRRWEQGANVCGCSDVGRCHGSFGLRLRRSLSRIVGRERRVRLRFGRLLPCCRSRSRIDDGVNIGDLPETSLKGWRQVRHTSFKRLR